MKYDGVMPPRQTQLSGYCSHSGAVDHQPATDVASTPPGSRPADGPGRFVFR